MRALSILLVATCTFPAPWGSQLYVAGMAKALAERGHRVAVASHPGPEFEFPGVELLRGPRWAGEPYAGTGPHWTRLPNNLLLYGRVRERLHRVSTDVVHAHHIDAPLLARLARLRARPLLVHSLHTSLEEELEEWYPGLVSAGRRVGALLDAWAPRVADAHVGISSRAVDFLRRFGEDRVLFSPPGVDVSGDERGSARRARERWGLGEHPWVAYTGNIDRYQDLPLLFAAVRREAQVRLLFVSAASTPDVLAVAAKSGIPRDRLRVVAEAGWPETRDALAVARAGVIPRRRCMGIPMKLLNYLAMGVPTVGVRGGCEPFPGVQLVERGDVPDLANALGRFVNDERAAVALGERGRAFAEKELSWSAQAKRLEQFYCAQMDRRAGSSGKLRVV